MSPTTYPSRPLRLCGSALKLILLFAIVILNGCAAETPVRQGKLKFLALGDSYTIGESVKASERWPVLLAELLRKEGKDVSDPQIIARTGWTTAELSAAIDAAKIAAPYDLVGLLIGVNNQFRGLKEDDYRKEFAALVKRAVGFARDNPGRVIVLSIPDYGVTPFAKNSDPKSIGAAIDRFNTINKEEATKAGVRYVDVTPISRKATDDPSLIAEDGLHPSGKMYAAWAAQVKDEAVKALISDK
jgi:lysophospholipase L1-like esterase